MRYGTYVGTQKSLFLKRAMLMVAPPWRDVRAQFDQLDLRDDEGTLVSHGWHIFSYDDFLIDPEVSFLDSPKDG